MLKHQDEVLNVERGPRAAARRRRLATASLFVVAWLSFVAFVALYRAPLPAEAFTALAVQLTHAADMARNA